MKERVQEFRIESSTVLLSDLPTGQAGTTIAIPLMLWMKKN